jgi:hypothetical protein
MIRNNTVLAYFQKEAKTSPEKINYNARILPTQTQGRDLN